MVFDDMLVDGWPEHASSLTRVDPSVVNAFVPQIGFALAMELFPKTSDSIRWVSVAVFLIWSYIWCRVFAIPHIGCNKNRRIGCRAVIEYWKNFLQNMNIKRKILSESDKNIVESIFYCCPKRNFTSLQNTSILS